MHGGYALGYPIGPRWLCDRKATIGDKKEENCTVLSDSIIHSHPLTGKQGVGPPESPISRLPSRASLMAHYFNKPLRMRSQQTWRGDWHSVIVCGHRGPVAALLLVYSDGVTVLVAGPEA